MGKTYVGRYHRPQPDTAQVVRVGAQNSPVYQAVMETWILICIYQQDEAKKL